MSINVVLADTATALTDAIQAAAAAAAAAAVLQLQQHATGSGNLFGMYHLQQPSTRSSSRVTSLLDGSSWVATTNDASS